MLTPRSSGLLLHPTSLPGRFGIGDLGPEAYRFVDFLVDSEQSLWQVMPVGPTSFGDSPYQCLSSCAGNPLLISPDRLVEDGLLPEEAIGEVPLFPAGHVDYGPVIEWKSALLWKAFHWFRQKATPRRKARFETFVRDNQYWLEEYALFKALKEHHGGAVWSDWAPEISRAEPSAVAHWGQKLAEAVWAQRYFQYLFYYQWRELKSYANERGVRIVGDMPIFVAYDSADVWGNKEYFHLDEDGRPTKVAGVPPDYFSETGQLWGNPLYRWDVLADKGYGWWIKRFRATFTLVDVLRVDHFRGFDACWEIPFPAKTAINGKWVKVPGGDLFATVEKTLGKLPILAEDLGVITPDVVALRDRFGFPGMKVLQFAFDDDASNKFLPHNYGTNYIVYTGTHDNDTTRGWYEATSQAVQHRARTYLGSSGDDIVWGMIRGALGSVASMAIFPMQDLLDLGPEARMNFPSKAEGNWGWRLGHDQIDERLAERLAELTRLYGRTVR